VSYGPGGVSRGVANITFHRADFATKAVETCNNIPVDGKPIKVNIIPGDMDFADSFRLSLF
jgi:THO complex subunit 4